MTVTWRRSAEPCGDVGASPDAASAGAFSPASGVPQLAQKLEPETLPWPHWWHDTGNVAPQRLQNRLASATSAPQLGHCMEQPWQVFAQA